MKIYITKLYYKYLSNDENDRYRLGNIINTISFEYYKFAINLR